MTQPITTIKQASNGSGLPNDEHLITPHRPTRKKTKTRSPRPRPHRGKQAPRRPPSSSADPLFFPSISQQGRLRRAAARSPRPLHRSPPLLPAPPSISQSPSAASLDGNRRSARPRSNQGNRRSAPCDNLRSWRTWRLHCKSPSPSPSPSPTPLASLTSA